jgi:hypothetical protein
MQRLKSAIRRGIHGVLKKTDVFRALQICRTLDAEAAPKHLIENLRIQLPAETEVSFGATAYEQRFLQVAKYFRDGSYSRPNVFTCEIPDGYCQIGTGLVCTRDFRVVNESQMAYRVPSCPEFKWFKPLRVRRLAGTCATIGNVYWRYWWHWLVDCLPRLSLLERAYPEQPIRLLVPADMAESYRESLACALPRNVTVEPLPPREWVQVERLLLPSYLSGRANGHLPAEHVRRLRAAVFSRCGQPPRGEPRARLYVSRAGAGYRRIINEGALTVLLKRYGFTVVAPERMGFKEQVALFREAEVLVAAHGSNWGNMVFSGEIKVLVLYPDSTPNTHIFTLAKALGQQHFFVAGREPSENSDFSVDLAAVERVLRDEMCLRAPVAHAGGEGQ